MKSVSQRVLASFESTSDDAGPGSEQAAVLESATTSVTPRQEVDGVWRKWDAPAPLAGFAGRVIARIRGSNPQQTRTLNSVLTRVRHWLLGEVTLSRLAAAMLVAATTLGLGIGINALSRPESSRALRPVETLGLSPRPPAAVSRPPIPHVFVRNTGSTDDWGNRVLLLRNAKGHTLRAAAFLPAAGE